MAKQKEKKENGRSSVDGLIRVLTVLLFAVLVAFFVKTQADIERMESQLGELDEQVVQQQLVNKDLELNLRDNQEYLERAAREKLDYAHPEERVFVDASGVN